MNSICCRARQYKPKQKSKKEMEAEKDALEELALADFAAEAGIVLEGGDDEGGEAEGPAVEEEKTM